MGTSKLLGDNLTKCWEVTCNGLVSHPGGVEIYLVASYLRKPEISAGLMGLCLASFHQFGQPFPYLFQFANKRIYIVNIVSQISSFHSKLNPIFHSFCKWNRSQKIVYSKYFYSGRSHALRRSGMCCSC